MKWEREKKKKGEKEYIEGGEVALPVNLTKPTRGVECVAISAKDKELYITVQKSK